MSNSVLEVRNLKRVVGGRVVITNLNFSVKSPGDVLFIRGASGVGKSLLLRVLACLDPLQASSCVLCCPVTHRPVFSLVAPATGRNFDLRRTHPSTDWGAQLAFFDHLRATGSSYSKGNTI